MKIIIVLVALVALAKGTSIDWKIVGGMEAEDGQFPFQASIRIGYSHNCGGSILNSRWILTAAHCLADYKPENLNVVVGSNSLNDTLNSVVYKVKSIIVNKSYNPIKLTNDIGLLKTNTDIRFTDKIKPIILNTAAIGGDQNLTLSGWGTTTFPGNIPNRLQYINLKSVEECALRHGFPEVIESQICTLTKAGEGACHGDSGSPLTYNGTLVGIVSWGRPCAVGYPDVCTRVSKFIAWINQNMK